jgi:hypothetical protein
VLVDEDWWGSGVVMMRYKMLVGTIHFEMFDGELVVTYGHDPLTPMTLLSYNPSGLACV